MTKKAKKRTKKDPWEGFGPEWNIVGRNGYTIDDFYRAFGGAGFSVPGRVAAQLAKRAQQAQQQEKSPDPAPKQPQDPRPAKP